MVMIYAMVFGAHLLPYSWLYRSRAYLVSAIVIPIGALALGTLLPTRIMALVCAVYEIGFAVMLYMDPKNK